MILIDKVHEKSGVICVYLQLILMFNLSFHGY